MGFLCDRFDSYLTDPHPSSNNFFATAGQTKLYKLKVTQSMAATLANRNV